MRNVNEKTIVKAIVDIKCSGYFKTPGLSKKEQPISLMSWKNVGGLMSIAILPQSRKRWLEVICIYQAIDSQTWESDFIILSLLILT